MASDLLDAVYGSLIGGAIGDALGAPVENWHYTDVRREHGRLTEFLPQPARSRDGAPGQITDDTTVLPLPDCASGGSVSPFAFAPYTASNAPCATYNREDEPDPVGCNWFDSPPKPTATSGDPFPVVPGAERAAPRSSSIGGPGGGWAMNLLAIGALVGVATVFRARRTTRG